MSYLELSRIDKRFGAAHAVRAIDLAVEQGHLVVLLGPSGCGKTTTLRMIAGLESPTSGSITLAGRDITRAHPSDRDIALVFQFYALYPHLTARRNIAFPLEARRMPREDMNRRVDAVIARLGLSSIERMRPSQLSGGDQQRVALARAMVRRPAAFLMDEPLGTLDAHQRESMREEIRRLHLELGATTVFVTHDQIEAMSLADRIAVMNNGRIEQYAAPADVYDQPATLFVARFIGSPGMNLLSGRAGPDRMLALDGCSVRVPIPPTLPVAPNQTLTIGVRPEHLRLASDGIEATVVHVERLGSHEVIDALCGENVLKVRGERFGEVDRRAVRLEIDPQHTCWFDSQSGKNLASI